MAPLSLREKENDVLVLSTDIRSSLRSRFLFFFFVCFFFGVVVDSPDIDDESSFIKSRIPVKVVSSHHFFFGFLFVFVFFPGFIDRSFSSTPKPASFPVFLT